MATELTPGTATDYAFDVLYRAFWLTDVEIVGAVETSESGVAVIDVCFRYEGDLEGCMTVWAEGGGLYGEW